MSTRFIGFVLGDRSCARSVSLVDLKDHGNNGNSFAVWTLAHRDGAVSPREPPQADPVSVDKRLHTSGRGECHWKVSHSNVTAHGLKRS